MDPFTALSTAGTIVQFVDFGSKLLSTGRELYKSTTGSLTVNDEIELVASDLLAITQKLRPEESPGLEFQQICLEAARLAQELLGKLDKLKVKTKSEDFLDKFKLKKKPDDGIDGEDREKQKWRTLTQAIASVWSKDEITALVERLSRIRQAIETRILLSLRDDVGKLSSNYSGRFDNLDQQTQQIISALFSQLGAASEAFSKEVQDQAMALTQLLSRIEDKNMSEHRKTRAMVKERVRKREEKILEEYRELKKERAWKQSRIHTEGRKVSDEKKTAIPNTYYDLLEDEAREDFFSNVPTEIPMEANAEITATPEVIDVTQKEERRARSLVHSKILESLKYSTMTSRYEDVAEAYPKTFDWLFDSFTATAVKSERTWDSFIDWLVSGSGVYWVNGKAASGKSTLMRYIYDNPKTLDYLKKWTKETPLCLATFFFWNSGSSEQKSQSGLLRALLYQVLEHHPELTPVILPTLWARTYSSVVRCLDMEEEKWPLSTLTQVFDTLIKQKAIELNICFLIDGLDEFEASQKNYKEMNYEEICGLFKSIASLQNIKVCLSSRPWVVFEDGFHNLPSLKLQDLTRGDIEYYTTSKFHNSNAFGRLSRENPGAAKRLISDVVDKSDGVFLWVRVVVQSLLTGLMNHDGLSDLERRLNILPRDLEALYEHMLKLTDPIYLNWASEVFQIYRTWQHHRDSVGPEDVVEPLTILALYLAVNGERLGIKGIMAKQEEDLLFECKEIGVQMTARCVGLLEISQQKSGTWSYLADPIRYKLNNQIRFMHRTARDFIERDDIWKQLLARTYGTSFNSYESLMKSCILQLSLAPSELFVGSQNTQRRKKHIRWVDRTATSGMICGYFADLQTNRANTEWLDLLDKIMTKFYDFHKLDNKHWSNQDLLRLHLLGGLSRGASIRELPFQDFISYAVQFSLTNYVDEKLRQRGPNINEDDEVPLLQYAVRCLPAVLRYPHSNKMVSFLLRSGEDPNRTYMGYTPWEEVLRSIRGGFILTNMKDGDHHAEQQLEYMKIIETLIEGGANPKAYIKDEKGSFSTVSLFCAIKRIFPEATKIEEELRRRGAKEAVSYRQRLSKWWHKES